MHTYANLLPTQLVDKEIPTVLYKRTKNIGSTLFNYKNTVNNVNTEEWLKQKHSCTFAELEFCDPEHKQIVSGDLRLIKNNKLRSVLCKGSKFRKARKVYWNFFESKF